MLTMQKFKNKIRTSSTESVVLNYWEQSSIYSTLLVEFDHLLMWHDPGAWTPFERPQHDKLYLHTTAFATVRRLLFIHSRVLGTALGTQTISNVDQTLSTTSRRPFSTKMVWATEPTSPGVRISQFCADCLVSSLIAWMISAIQN